MKYYRHVFLTALVTLLVLGSTANAQVETEWRVYPEPKDTIQFPDILGYETLKCDFHMHTVFSDGLVWPSVRVEEAWREGLDAISITDHIEYQPHENDIPTDHNRPYEMVVGHAKRRNILLPRGTEITRDTPPGHFNAIFLKDVDELEQDNLLDVIETANEQGGFVFWNHPGWKGPERGKWGEIQEAAYENKWLHGIEVFNGGTYYPEAHQYAVEHDLTILGTSDIHDPSLILERTIDVHRTITLVFVRERTLDALREALFEGRTVVWFKNQLIGQEEYLDALFDASVKVKPPYYSTDSAYWFEIDNQSEIDFLLERAGDYGPENLIIPAESTVQMMVKCEEDIEELPLSYHVTNLVVAPEEPLTVEFSVQLK